MGAGQASRRKASEKSAVANAPLSATSTISQKTLLYRGFLFLMIASVGCAADLISKQLVFAWRGLPLEANEWWIIKGFFGIETSLNQGAVFGVGAGYSNLFAILAFVAVGGIFCWLFLFRAAEDLYLTLILAMITGGILGNLYDRLGIWSQSGLPQEWAGHEHSVRDWILFRYKQWTWPNFNIADCLLVVGAGMMLVHSFWLSAKEKAAEQAKAKVG